MSGIIRSDIYKITGYGDDPSYLITREEADEDGEKVLRIDHDALRKLLIRPEIGDKPIAIISIAGCMRTGKSFIMNFILRYLRQQGWKNRNWIGDGESTVGKDGMKFGGGSNPITKGVRVFEEIFEVPIDDKQNMIVMLMDTQGLFDHDTPEVVNKSLLTLCALLSSVQIFNSMKQINTQHLRYLKTCIDFASLTASFGETSGDGQPKGYFKMQRLMFLVRDFPEDQDVSNPNDSYGSNHGRKYLEEILSSKKGGAELNDIRTGIKKSFDQVGCFPLPSPGLKANKRNFSGKNRDLESDFLEFVKGFVEEICSLDKLVPKHSVDKKYVTARHILNMATACDTIFSHRVFDAKHLAEANEKAYYAAVYEEAIGEYDHLMKEIDNEHVDEDWLNKQHSDSKMIAFRQFSSCLRMGRGHYRDRYENHFKEKCDDHFEKTKLAFRARQKEKEAKMREKAHQAIVKYKSAMQAEAPLALDEEEFDKCHVKTYEKIRHHYAQQADLNKMEKEVTELYDRMKADNAKRFEKQKEISREKRRENLYVLVNKSLMLQCAKEWEKNLENYCDESVMEKRNSEICDMVRENFWEGALSEMEMECRRKLDQKLEQEYQNAVYFIRNKMPYGSRSAAPRKLQQYWTAEERKYYDEVNKVVQDFAKTLEIRAKDESEKEFESKKVERMKIPRRTFFDFCSPYLASFFDELADILETAYKEACRINKENWNILEEKMRNSVHEQILHQRIVFSEIMNDRHINEGEIEKYFQRALDEAKKNPPQEFLEVLNESKEAKKTYEDMIDEQMKVSLDEVLKENKAKEDNRTVTQTSAVPETAGFFKRAVKWIKSVFSK